MSISSILPFATKMESKLRDGTWTPVMRCPRDTPRTSHQGEATPPILLPLAPTGHRHSPHNRIQAAGIILMDPYPLVRQTPGSPMLTRHPRTTRMTKIVFTVIVMPWVAIPNCLALVISAIRPRPTVESPGCSPISTTVRGNNLTSRGLRWQTTCSHCGDKRPPPVETPVSPPPVLPIKETIPICTLYFLPHLFWPPPTPQPLPPLPWQPRTCLCHLHLHPAHSLAAPACPRRAPMRPICTEAPEALTHLLALFTS